MVEKENVEMNKTVMDPNENKPDVPVENYDVRQKKIIKPTEKASEAKLTQLINKRKTKLSEATGKKNVINSLMIDYGNTAELQQCFGVFKILTKEFSHLHYSVQVMLPEQEQEKDHINWYLPKIAYFNEFQDVVNKWIIRAASFEQAPPPEHDLDVSSPIKAVSISMISRRGSRSYTSGSSRSSTASSTRRKAEAERATLLARAAALQQKHALEKQEAELEAVKVNLRAEM